MDNEFDQHAPTSAFGPNGTGFVILPYDLETGAPLPLQGAESNVRCAWVLEVRDADAAVEYLIDAKQYKRVAAEIHVARMLEEQNKRHLG